MVTGSRIARPDFVANSPVTTVGQEELELSGATTIESLLNELPQVVPGIGATSNNPGLNGQATVDLRGLGSERTLVLVNGRRLSPSDKEGTVDLNVIPAALVERIEVVTGGTSAVYGSDALAGVVNFILKEDFEGVELSGSGGQSAKGDATEYQVDLTAGGNFADGRGNAVIFGSYYDRDTVFQDERDYSRNATFGSSRTPAGSLERSILNPFPGGASRLAIDDAGDDVGTFSAYNFAPPNMLVLPADRIVLGGFANYDFTDTISGYAEMLFADSRTAVQLAPTPVAASTGLTVPAAAALAQLPGATAQAEISGRADPGAPLVVQRRMVESGPRFQAFDKKFYQTTFGLNGDIFEGWKWDAFYSFARTDMYDSLFNDQNKERFQQALNLCPAGSVPGCVPIDLFGLGSITQAGVDFIDLDNVTDHHEYEQQIVGVNLTGDVWELPAGSLGVAFGFNYGSDALDFTPDPNSRGNLVGFNGVQAVGGKTTVREVYAEALVPLVSDMTGIQYLGLELGGRLSNYSSVGDVETWKIGGEWAINDIVRLRAMYNVATRAPTVFELFRAGDQNFPGYGDPCENVGGVAALDGAVVAPASAGFNFCAEWLGLDPLDAGTPATLGAFAASDTQVEEFRFGNSNLDPEESETYTIGAVIQAPTPVGDFSLTVDYFNIEVTDFITIPNVNTVIARCVATLDVTSTECAATPRISSGQLAGVQNLLENTPGGGIETSGIDVAAGYSVVPEDIGMPVPGSLDVSALVTYLEEYNYSEGAINGGDYTGVHTSIGNFGGFPEWKSNVRTTYSYNDWQFSWQWERIGEMDDYGYTAAYGYPKLEAINYHDFSLRWFATENIDATVICENCFDKEPQGGTVSGYLSGANIDASTYDGIGRFYRFSLTSRF